jgi:hypothetical protein
MDIGGPGRRLIVTALLAGAALSCAPSPAAASSPLNSYDVSGSSRTAPAAAPLFLHQAATATAQEEYAALFAGLARQALADARLAARMPCLPHWLAGSDHVVVAVSPAGAAAGLAAGDRLERIGTTALTGRAGGMWDTAIRALESGPSYAVDVGRGGTTVALTLPCAPEAARALHEAERAMWTAVTLRLWDDCIARGRDMIRAFGANFSPPLMIMTRCASARTGAPDGELTYALGSALLDEMVAHPAPSTDQREQLLLTLRDLDAIRRAGGNDYASRLRDSMSKRGVPPPAPMP